jgi:gluconokinase
MDPIPAPVPPWIVVMGICGCGKSSVGGAVARALCVPMIEGDAFHPAANVEKMRAGHALDDADRAGWLDLLAGQLAAHPGGAVLACSALKRAYRDRLRRAVPRLRFVFLALTREEALARVAGRAGHFMPPSMVDSQLATLEPPAGEVDVVTVDATDPVATIVARVSAALSQAPTYGAPPGGISPRRSA